ncbi:HAD family hydrolase [Micromonospora sp. bgisy143]|uniref:HAD family hydrolase n=1 Tax=Micromonospora sp. bgisy143 TaxID=3413790 RepID=UPI003EC0521D
MTLNGDRVRVPLEVWRLLRECDGVIWDFDGVVADTEPTQGESFRLMLERLGVQPVGDFFRGYVGRSEREIWEDLSAEHRLRSTLDELATARSKIYLELATSTLAPAFYVSPMLDEADELGVANFVVSSGSYRNIWNLLQTWKLGQRFAAIYCAGSPESSALHTKKERLSSVLARHRCPLVVEDSADYLRLASSLGARTIGIQHSLNDLSQVSADLVIKVPSQY